MKCPNCQAEVVGKFCSYCDSEMPTEKEPSVNSNHAAYTTVNNYYIQQPQQSTQATIRSTVIVSSGRSKNKWVSFFLCLFTICGHKFYEGKMGIGFLYLFTMGIFGMGWIIDLIILLTKPRVYYVN